MFRTSRHQVELPADVLLSVREVSRAARRGEPQIPPWLKRVLPKSGMAGRLEGEVAGRDMADDFGDDDPEFDDSDDEVFATSGAALAPVSFDVRAGQGIGIAGTDADATTTLRRILGGQLPPTTGSVVIRGRLVA